MELVLEETLKIVINKTKWNNSRQLKFFKCWYVKCHIVVNTLTLLFKMYYNLDNKKFKKYTYPRFIVYLFEQ